MKLSALRPWRQTILLMHNYLLFDHQDAPPDPNLLSLRTRPSLLAPPPPLHPLCCHAALAVFAALG